MAGQGFGCSKVWLLCGVVYMVVDMIGMASVGYMANGALARLANC